MPIELPPELVEKLADTQPVSTPMTLGPDRDRVVGIRMHSDKEAVRIVLEALLAHAGPDATHIDLSTWGGVRAVCSNCDGQKCMACVFREQHGDCEHDCPMCTEPLVSHGLDVRLYPAIDPTEAPS